MRVVNQLEADRVVLGSSKLENLENKSWATLNLCQKRDPHYLQLCDGAWYEISRALFQEWNMIWRVVDGKLWRPTVRCIRPWLWWSLGGLLYHAGAGIISWLPTGPNIELVKCKRTLMLDGSRQLSSNPCCPNIWRNSLYLTIKMLTRVTCKSTVQLSFYFSAGYVFFMEIPIMSSQMIDIMIPMGKVQIVVIQRHRRSCCWYSGIYSSVWCLLHLPIGFQVPRPSWEHLRLAFKKQVHYFIN